MNALEAAAVVLQDADQPLHYREITERMPARKLWTTAGKTPWETVNARIAVDIKTRGIDSRFVRTAPGCYAPNPDVAGETRTVGGKRNRTPGEMRAAADSLSFTDAAERVLSQSSNQEPLHYRVITHRPLEQGLIRTQGRTPAATMYSMILTEIRRQEARGDSPRFVQHGRGMVGLAAWLPLGVAGLVEEKNREVRRALLDRARTASPPDFEDLVGELLAAMGFEDIEVTQISGDGGTDVRGTLVDGRLLCTAPQLQETLAVNYLRVVVLAEPNDPAGLWIESTATGVEPWLWKALIDRRIGALGRSWRAARRRVDLNSVAGSSASGW